MHRRDFMTGATASAATLLGSVVATTGGAHQQHIPTEERVNLGIMHQWVDNLQNGEGAANDRFKAVDMTVTVADSLPYGGTLPDADYAAQIQQYWGPPATPPTDSPELFADGDKVVLLGVFTATANATGVEIAAPLAEVFTFVDRRVINDSIYFFDTAALLDALGPQS